MQQDLNAQTEMSDLISFLDASPSPWHAVESTIDRLDGFTRLHETESWTDIPAAGYIVRGGAIVAWRLPSGDASTASAIPFRIAGAHTDSPCLRVKPQPDRSNVGWKQLGVEVYGGILNNTWLDRDLGLAGRVIWPDGTVSLVDVRRPIARVSQLAVHLDRNVNEGGLVLDRQQHLTPMWGVGVSRPGDFARWIGDEAGRPTTATGDPTWWELCLYDTQGAAVIGADSSMLASGRLDNLLSCWAATRALASAAPTDHIAMIVLNDHEEVGSSSATGAAGPFLESVIQRLVAVRSDRPDEHLHRALAGSMCISADNAHAVHPNYPERHDPGHHPMINAGPALKVNANQRYATSAETASAFQRACDQADVPWQVFVSANNMPCGSTIGPITSTRLGIATADIGVPQLSMHSARELCGADDPGHLAASLRAFLN